MKKFAVLIASFIGALLLITAVINTSVFDEELSPNVKALQQVEPMSFKSDNAYFAAMGLNADSDRDMVLAGLALIKRYLINRVEHEFDGLKPEDEEALLGIERLSDNMDGWLTRCRSRTDASCGQNWLQRINADVYDTQRIKVLLKRYDELTEQPRFHSLTEVTLNSPLPSYQYLMTLSQLYLAEPLLAEQMGDWIKRIEKDTQFWRRVLGQGNTLISRMVAVAALWNNLQSAVWVAQHYELSPDEFNRLEAMFIELTEQEWSLAHALTFEMKIMVQSTGNLKDYMLEEDWYMNDVLFQPNATANLMVKHFQPVIDASKLPMAEFIRQYTSFKKQTGERPIAWSPSTLYNPVGKILASIGNDSYLEYMARVHDLNGMFLMGRIVFHYEKARAAQLLQDDTQELSMYLPQKNNRDADNVPLITLNVAEKMLNFQCLEQENDCRVLIR